MSTIYTRASKGSALTWAEGDANITNLNNDKMENFTVAADSGTSQTISGGNTLTIAGGTGLSSVASATDTVTINLDDTAVTPASYTLASITVDAQGRITAASSGSVTYPTITDDTTTNTTHYITFEDATSGSASSLKVSSTKLTFNPSTGTVTATTFSGSLSGNATTATTATNANNINISTTNGNTNDTTLYPVMVGASTTGNQLPHIDSSGLAFNANTNALTLGSASGNTASINFGSSGGGDVTVTGPNTASNLTITLPSASGTLLNSNGTLTGVFNGSTVTASSSITPNNTGGANINFGTSGLSASAWTTLGIAIRQQARNYTDSSSTGTVSVSAINGFGIPTLASTNAITVTEAANLYVQPPSAGTNTTITTSYGLISTGRIKATDFVGTIGATTASTGAFTTLSASSTVSGTGFSTYLASPPAIGGTAAAAGSFTTLSSSGLTTANSLTVTTNATLKDIRETVFAIGNSGATTLTPDAANGSVQTITATGNFTLSAFSNPVSGQTITFIITQDATGSRTLTSTMKFAGGSKTLSTAANSIDILTVSYIGTTYYASLAKGFA